MPDEYPDGYLDMLKSISDEMKKSKNHAFKKSEMFSDKAPSWLADEFDIKWIRYTDLIEKGVKFLSPYEEFVCSCPLFFDDDKKYDVVIMWVGGEGTDIKLF
jgi:hypothetical protein